MRASTDCVLVSENQPSSAEPGTQLPATVAPQRQGGADQRGLDHAAGAQAVHVQADQEANGDGAGNGEGSPRTAGDDLRRALRKAHHIVIGLQLALAGHLDLERLRASGG